MAFGGQAFARSSFAGTQTQAGTPSVPGFVFGGVVLAADYARGRVVGLGRSRGRAAARFVVSGFTKRSGV